MIIGYQVQDQNGNNWSDRPSYLVLTEQTAVEDLKAARSSKTGDYSIVGILRNDIQDPILENRLAACQDQYKTVRISPSQLEPNDNRALNRLASDPVCNRIIGKPGGIWFAQLHEDTEQNLGDAGMSDRFHAMLDAAQEEGYNMIEFNPTATEYTFYSVSWE
jgi:hypothetical protein